MTHFSTGTIFGSQVVAIALFETDNEDRVKIMKADDEIIRPNRYKTDEIESSSDKEEIFLKCKKENE